MPVSVSVWWGLRRIGRVRREIDSPIGAGQRRRIACHDDATGVIPRTGFCIPHHLRAWAEKLTNAARFRLFE